MNNLKDKKVNLIGHHAGIDGSDWRILFRNTLNELGSEIVPHYIKPYIYTPREKPATHEAIKLFKDTSYGQKTSEIPGVSVLDKSWIAEHMKATRSAEIDIVKNSDLVICHIDPSLPSFGVMEQLCYAHFFKKPTFLVVTGGFTSTPIWLLGMVPYDYVYETFDGLKKAINDIDSGKISIKEDDYWELYNKAYDE